MPSHAGSGDSLPFDQRRVFGNARLHGVCEHHGDAHRRTVATGNKAANRRSLTDGHTRHANADLNARTKTFTLSRSNPQAVPAPALCCP
jgi:hypothetical protein